MFCFARYWSVDLNNVLLIGHFQQTSLLSRAKLDIEKVKAGGVSRLRHIPAVKRLEGLRAGLQRNYQKKLISPQEFLVGIGGLSLKAARKKKRTQWDEAPPELPVVNPTDAGFDSDDSLRYSIFFKFSFWGNFLYSYSNTVHITSKKSKFKYLDTMYLKYKN